MTFVPTNAVSPVRENSDRWMRTAAALVLAALTVLFATHPAEAQHLFTTAHTNGFGSPAILVGISGESVDLTQGEDVFLFTVRGSVGIGRKTDIFGGFHSVNGRGLTDTTFLAWSAGINHQFIRTPIVDLGGIVQVRGNRTDQERFEDALLDFAGIVSLGSSLPFHPYYSLVFSRPLGFSLDDSFQRTSIVGVEVPIGDIPRIFGEFGFGDRTSFGVALKLAF